MCRVRIDVGAAQNVREGWGTEDPREEISEFQEPVRTAVLTQARPKTLHPIYTTSCHFLSCSVGVLQCWQARSRSQTCKNTAAEFVVNPSNVLILVMTSKL